MLVQLSCEHHANVLSVSAVEAPNFLGTLQRTILLLYFPHATAIIHYLWFWTKKGRVTLNSFGAVKKNIWQLILAVMYVWYKRLSDTNIFILMDQRTKGHGSQLVPSVSHKISSVQIPKKILWRYFEQQEHFPHISIFMFSSDQWHWNILQLLE